MKEEILSKQMLYYNPKGKKNENAIWKQTIKNQNKQHCRIPLLK